MGIEGAAIGTLLGYIIAIVITAVILTKMKLIKICARFYGISIICIAYLVCWRLFFQREYICWATNCNNSMYCLCF